MREPLSTTPHAAQSDDAGRSSRPVPSLTDADITAGVLARLRTVVTTAAEEVAIIDVSGVATFADLAAGAADVASLVTGVAGTAAHQVDITTPPLGLGTARYRPPVAVLCGHHAGAAAAVIGVIASGHPVLMLDTRAPVPRLHAVMERVGARWCLADTEHLGIARRVAGQLSRPVDDTVLRAPDQVAGTGSRGAGRLWRYPCDPASPALLGFTSGSTGTSKVVAVDQRQIMAHTWVESTAADCYGADDVMAHTLPMAFNAGLLATLAGPLVGAVTALYDVRAAGVAALPAWLQRSRASVLYASPAILRALVQSDPDLRQLSALRVLTVAGEPSHGRDIQDARRLLPPTCTIHNRYGSTETSLIAEFLVRPGDPPLQGPLPAGTPVGHTRVTLVADDGTPVPPGDSGIVTVTRAQMALGYWDDAERTAATFTDNPDGTRTCRTSDVGRFDEHGRLHLLGRRDHSVKIRGFLVEPGEIDAALFALPEIREAVVVGRPRAGDGLMHLVAYVVPAPQRCIDPAALRSALARTLPSYMVPGAIVTLEALPRTERGKIDRSQLPEPPDAARGADGQQFSAWERVMADTWSRVLHLEDIGLDDDFFELGGDSLAVEALITAVVTDLGIPPDKVGTALLLRAPTVRTFAAQLTRSPDRNDVLIPVQPQGSRLPLFLVAGGGGIAAAFLPLARRLGPDQPLWALQAYGMERRGLPDRSVQAMARRYLRHVRQVQPRGPYLLAGHSFGGLVALEMAHQLHRTGAQVAHLIILDSFPPDPRVHAPRPPQPLAQRAKEFVGIRLTGIRGTPGKDQYWRFYRLSERLHRRYRCPPWPGDTTVVLADSPEQQARAGWAPFLPGCWTTVQVAGDHWSMLREPLVGETAAAITHVADTVQPGAARSC